MAGNIVESELTVAKSGRVEFAVATHADDADIRRLLRENAMSGQISLSLEREPDYFTDANLPGETKQTIIARERGRTVCAGSCTIRRRFVNGEPCRVGYLGGLRLDASAAGRFDIVRRGYEFFHELQTSKGADYYFTSIAADNQRARRLLERGLPGMPRYEFLADFVTVLLPTRRPASISGTTAEQTPNTEALVSFINSCNQNYQLAPCWSARDLHSLGPLGLESRDFCVVQANSRLSAAAALWDQRRFKQTVVRGYAPSLKLARPLINLLARVSGGIRLPAIGQRLASAFVSHLAIAPNKDESLKCLIAKLRSMAARRGIELLILGFATDDPRLAALRRQFRFREYYSRLYVVRWRDCGGSAEELDNKILAPEVTLL
jgi:hypothetical protein